MVVLDVVAVAVAVAEAATYILLALAESLVAVMLHGGYRNKGKDVVCYSGRQMGNPHLGAISLSGMQSKCNQTS